VKAGIRTRAPRGRPSAFIDRNSAAEQDETASAYLRPEEVGEVAFEKRHGRVFGRGVAEEVARREQPLNLGAGGFGDGLGVVSAGADGHVPDFLKPVFGHPIARR
jgi:hypothetical protein